MWMMMVFGTAALVLAAIGIYGRMAYSVEQRTQEIGIRLALGASGAQVRKIVVSQGLALTFSGVAIGIAASLGLTQFLASFLYGVKARDPFVFISVPLILGAVSFIAVWIPARRASRVNPIDALRCQ